MASLKDSTTITISGSCGTNWFNGGIVGNKEKTIIDFKPVRVTYSGLTTIVFWSDDTKTIVRCGENDVYDREHAVAEAIAHKLFGSTNQFKKFVRNGYEAMTVDENLDRQRIKEQKKRDQDLLDEFSF